MADKNHSQNESLVTNSLIDFSEDVPSVDKLKHKSKITCDWSEGIIGWKDIVPNPQYVPYIVSNVIKKRKSEKVPEWSRNLTSYDDWMGESKVGVRCIGDDFENIPVPPWKANVEQGTFRYVPNNGYYRTIKFLQLNERRDWFTVTKKHPEKVSMTWQNKRFQKEIKRQLKKELDNFQTRYIQHQQQAHKNHQNQQTSNDTYKELSNQTNRSDISSNVETNCDSYRLHSHRARSEYMESSSNNSRVNSCTTRVDSNGNVVASALSLRSAPVASLYKSTTDLYIQNFSHRISALEAEIKRDSRINARKQAPEDVAKPPIQPTKSQILLKAQKEVVNQKPKEIIKEPTPRSLPVSRKEMQVVAQESITIKQVGSRDHRPTEIHSNIHKFISTNETKSNSPQQQAQLKYTTTSVTSAAHINFPTIHSHLGSGELDKTLNSYKVAIENTKQSLLQTLTSSKVPRKGSNKGFSAPAAIAVCENVTGKKSKERFLHEKGSVPLKEPEKEIEKKTAITGILPEISGKRLEVPATSHRWL